MGIVELIVDLITGILDMIWDLLDAVLGWLPFF